ncbi:MAG: HAD family acid phosphatase [Bacteroidota bacterium]
MKSHRVNVVLTVVCVIALGATSLSFVSNKSPEPRNLSLCKEEVKSYVTSKQYMEDISAITSEAENYIAEHINPSKRNAIVLDIDETSLSNLKYELEMDFGYTSSTWSEWRHKSQALPILPTLKLYEWAQSRKIAVFFVTGTTEDLREPVKTNLLNAGYVSWDSLYMRPVKDGEKAAVYKPKVRKEITVRGYYIIASIGDQESDLVGGYVEKTFKLPNPMYIVK